MDDGMNWKHERVGKNLVASSVPRGIQYQRRTQREKSRSLPNFAMRGSYIISISNAVLIVSIMNRYAT